MNHLVRTVTLALGAIAAACPVRVWAQDEEEDERYRFLKLGRDRDYLEAERWRLIDQVEQAIPPLYEPVRPFHGYTLPPGAWRVGLSATYGNNPGDFGRDEFYALFFDKVDVDFLQLNLDVWYGFEIGPIRDLTVNVQLPYKFQRTEGTGHPFRIDPMEMTMNGSGQGIGDLQITLKKKWLDQADGFLTFSTMLGAILPTASDEQEFDASQTIFMNGMVTPVSAHKAGDPSVDVFSRKAGERFFPRAGQPGNGSWGLRLGFGAGRQFARSAFHAGAVLDLLADNDGITPGHEFKYGISFVFPPFAADFLTIDLAVFGMWKGAEEFPGTIMHPERDPATGGPVMDGSGTMVMFVTDRPDFKRGNATFFSPSVVFVPSPNTRIYFSPAFRIVEPEQGPSPAFTLTLGATITF